VRDFPTDAAKTDNPDAAMAELRRERVLAGQPFPTANEAIRGRDVPENVKQQANGQVGYTAVEHIGRVAHHDIARASGIEVYGVVTDTDIHDRSEGGKAVDQIRFGSHWPRNNKNLDEPSVIGEKRRALNWRTRERQDSVMLTDPLDQGGKQGGHLENADGRSRMPVGAGYGHGSPIIGGRSGSPGSQSHPEPPAGRSAP